MGKPPFPKLKDTTPRPLTNEELERLNGPLAFQLASLAGKFSRPDSTATLEVVAPVNNNGFTNPRSGSTNWKKQDGLTLTPRPLVKKSKGDKSKPSGKKPGRS